MLFICILTLGWGQASADALSSPSMTPPLTANPNPAAFDAPGLGEVYISGQLTVLALSQTHAAASPFSGNSADLIDLSNAQFEIQTVSGPVQFYIQTGAYALPALGSSYLPAARANSALYGPAPVAYLKLAPAPDLSVQIGALPTLIGAESTFTFQNMNIERGLLWTQEPAVSRGVQFNYSHGPVLLSASINDGDDSGRYDWASGLASYALNGESTIVIDGGFNFGRSATNTYAAPVAQNNSRLLNLMYVYAKGPLVVNPYLQLSSVSADPALGLPSSASTASGAVLAKWSFTPRFSLAGRVEYIDASAGGCGAAPPKATNLLYGPRSRAASVTLTPTYQKGPAFIRAEVSYVAAARVTTGDAFGPAGLARTQTRALVETGLLF